MVAEPLVYIHIVGIVAEWLVQYLKCTGHAVRVPERNKPANNPYQNCAGMPPSVQAAKPGQITRPRSKMLGLQNRSPHNDLGYAGHSAEQRPSYLLPDRHVRGTRTLVLFPDGNYACNIDGRLSAAHYSHCRYCGRVVSAGNTERAARGSNPREGLTSQQPLPALCRNAAVGAGGQTGTGRGAVNGQR